MSTAFVPLAALWRARLARTRREAVQAAAVLALSAAAAVLPWTARNVFVIGDLVPVESISVYNFWDDNAFVDGDRRRHQEARDRQPAHARRAAQPGHVVRVAGDRPQPRRLRREGLAEPACTSSAWTACTSCCASRSRIRRWRHAALILLDDTVMLATVPCSSSSWRPAPRSPARSLILLWSGYYLLMVVVIFHNEIRYRSTLMPFALAGAAGGAALLADPAGAGAARPCAAPCSWALVCAAGMLAPYVVPAVARRAVHLDAARACSRGWTPATSPARKASSFRAASEDRVAARPWLVFGSALARAGEPARALDAYRRAEERKAYVWTPRLVRPQLLAEAGLPVADALAEADAFSWHVDPWLALEVAWRALPAPRTDEVLLARGDYGAVRGFTLPRRDHRWSMDRAWIRLRPVTTAAAYVVSAGHGLPAAVAAWRRPRCS